MRKKIQLAGVVGACVLACSITGCAEAAELSDQVQSVRDKEDKHVLSVKNGHPITIPDITYAQAFESFFANPTWKYFKSEDGEQVVEFTGYCTYQDAKVKAGLQFILSEDDDTFETGALSFNDVPQSTIIANAMVYKAFSEYASSHDIEIGDGDSIWTSTEDNEGTKSDTKINGNGDNSVSEEKNTDNQEFSMNLVDDMAYYSELDSSSYGYCLSFRVEGKKILFDIITSTNRYERMGYAKAVGINTVRCYMENDKKKLF